MAELSKTDVERLLEKYKGRLDTEFGAPKPTEAGALPPAAVTKEYLEFLEELRPKHMGWYEKACNFCAKLLKMKVKKQRYDRLQEEIDVCHLNITPEGVETLSLLGPLAYMMVGAFLSFVLFTISLKYSSCF